MSLIDNVNKTLGDDLKAELKSGAKLKIAASFFSIYAFDALKKELGKIKQLQFVFTSPTFVTDTAKKEKREFIIPKLNRERGLYGSEFEIHLKNKLTQKAIAKECAAWIRNKGVFYTNTSNMKMQDFICIKNDNSVTAYNPIQGFTSEGLGYEKSNSVSNFVHKINQPAAKQYMHLFDQVCSNKNNIQEITDKIISHIETVYQENAPQRIYFLFIYNIFKDFLQEINPDVMPNDLTGYRDSLIWNKLYSFQQDAAIGIINKLEKYNGCILADSVGLGKTFTALAVIKYYELKNKSVLVLCPKKISEIWTNYNANLVTNLFVKDRFNYDVLFHTDLSRYQGETLGIDLAKVNWGNYDLVVIDESHNFRNRSIYKDKISRYQRLLDEVMRQGVKTKVLMLSATPVNNSFGDLKNQLALAYEGETENLDQKLDTSKNIDTIFKNAQQAFNKWSKFSEPQRTTQAILNLLDFDFFKLLDSVTIARSRQHIKNFYNSDEIGGFPRRLKPISHSFTLSDSPNSIGLDQIYEDLSGLNLAVYTPLRFVFASKAEKYANMYDTTTAVGGKFKQKDRETSLQTLMTINILKRLESSVCSFRITLTNISNKMHDLLDKINRYQEDTKNGFFDVVDGDLGYDDDENDDTSIEQITESEHIIGDKQQINLADVDTCSWKKELQQDVLVIDELLQNIEEISPQHDSKLQQLKQQIIDKVKNPINQGNKKVIVFTAYSDTADYLYQNLAAPLGQQLGIHSAKITGAGAVSTIGNIAGSAANPSMQELLTLFSPLSKQKADIFPHEERTIDLLIATDCVSEGQNLQDCDYLINYDIHWNPVRIIQRFGRIDRIGSPNKQIQLVNYWPGIALEKYIKLREKVQKRLVIANLASTGDENLLSEQQGDIPYRQQQLKRLQQGELDLEENSGGVSITDLGLNSYRMDLLNYIETKTELKSSIKSGLKTGLKQLPKGLHAVVPATAELEAGVIFALKSLQKIAHKHIINQLHPYYLIYVNYQQQVVYDHTQTKHLLELCRQACYGQDQPIAEVYQPFNRRTQDGLDMRLYSQLLDVAINSIQKNKQQQDINSLFSGQKTSALEGDIAGVSDFELIGFIVIEDNDKTIPLP